MYRPRVAIPEINQNVSNYTAAVYAAGMQPVVISVQDHQVAAHYQQEYMDYSQFHASRFEGLLLPGGVDINPARYGQKNVHCVHVCDEMDELQFSILDDFVKEKKPVFGVCRGFQILNVYFGGTMIQHIPSFQRHGKKSVSDPDKVHGCCAQADSWIGRLYGSRFSINSAHHQGVDRLGTGLDEDAWCSEDHIVEAVHHRTLPIYGVQWHPERTCLAFRREDTVDGLEILKFFCGILVGGPEQDENPEVMCCGMGL